MYHVGHLVFGIQKVKALQEGSRYDTGGEEIDEACRNDGKETNEACYDDMKM